MDKVPAPQQSLSGHQEVLSKLQADQDKVMHTRFVVSELFAKKLKPHTYSEFVKECLVASSCSKVSVCLDELCSG